MAASTTFSAPFLRSLLPPDTNILRPIISFEVKTTCIDKKYEPYSRTCAYGSSLCEGVDLTVSYAPVDVILSFCIILAITSEEGLIIFVLDISYDFKNNILPNPEERVYLSLPDIYLDLYKIK